jgi:hypothetical protein
VLGQLPLRQPSLRVIQAAFGSNFGMKAGCIGACTSEQALEPTLDLRGQQKQAILLLATGSGTILSLRYTPGQLRTAAVIAPETYRHWKKALAPLRRHKGHSPCFSAGDLVAVAVVRVLTIEFEIRVSALSPLGEKLFSLCNSGPWPTLERGRLMIDVPGRIVQFQPEPGEPTAEGPILLMPLGPIIARLRDQLLAAGEPENQTMLRFPPTSLASRSKGAIARTRP